MSKWVWWVVVAFLWMLVALVFMPVGVNSPGLARRTQTLSNLKQLAMAARTYAEDNSGKLPPGLVSVATLKNAGATKLPDQESLNKDSPHFLANSSLGGKRIADVPDPDRTLLFFDSAPWPDNKRCAAFVDGHVRVLAEDRFQAAVANKWVLPREPS